MEFAILDELLPKLNDSRKTTWVQVIIPQKDLAPQIKALASWQA